MTTHKLVAAFFSLLAALPIADAPAHAAALPRVESNLYEAYYLEHESGDFAAAKELYDTVLRSDGPAEMKQAARAGSDRCRDHLAAKDFARLMPEDALVYIEINRPGEIIEKLAGMLGLTGGSIRDVLAGRPSIESAAPFYIPSEITISPAIFDALGSFGGAALAFTDFDFDGHRPPSGVLVIHHGDVNLIKGLLETAFQFAPTVEKIRDMPTFGHTFPEVGQITGVLTESLLIVGTGRDVVEGVVDRLAGATSSSLAAREDLQKVRRAQPDSTFFAYANLQGIYELSKANIQPHNERDLAILNAFADFDSLRWATFSMGIHDDTLGCQLAVRFADQHRSIIYNMMRLPPMSRNCLKHVPPNAAAFFGIGLNPAIAQAAVNAAETKADGPTTVTGFDLGREFFGNIQEICTFVIPGKMRELGEEFDGAPLPNVGILLAVNDVAKSRALWGQLLALPGLIAGDEPIEPKPMKIERTEVTAYAIPEFGNIYMAELDNCITVGLTRSALKASIRAHNKNTSILDDEIMGKVIAGMPRDSSIMIAAHVGRLAEVACGVGEPEVAMAAKPTAQLCKNMVAWFGVGQSPNQFTLRGAVSGLPDVNEALQLFAPLINGAAGMAMRSRTTEEIEVSQREARPAPRIVEKEAISTAAAGDESKESL